MEAQDKQFLARLKAQITGLEAVESDGMDPMYRNLFLTTAEGRTVLKDLGERMYFSSYGVTADHMKERNAYLGILRLCGIGGGDILDAILLLQGER